MLLSVSSYSSSCSSLVFCCLSFTHMTHSGLWRNEYLKWMSVLRSFFSCLIIPLILDLLLLVISLAHNNKQSLVKDLLTDALVTILAETLNLLFSIPWQVWNWNWDLSFDPFVILLYWNFLLRWNLLKPWWFTRLHNKRVIKRLQRSHTPVPLWDWKETDKS